MNIRPFKRCDADTIVSWIKSEKIFRYWCADRFDHYPITPFDLNDQYENSEGCEDVYHFTAYDEEGICGHLNIRFPDASDLNTVRFGYVILDDSRRGQGLGKEMIRLAADYAFNIMKATRITIGVFEENGPAVNCYLKSGVKDTGIVEKYSIGDETWNCLELMMTKDQ